MIYDQQQLFTIENHLIKYTGLLSLVDEGREDHESEWTQALRRKLSAKLAFYRTEFQAWL